MISKSFFKLAGCVAPILLAAGMVGCQEDNEATMMKEQKAAPAGTATVPPPAVPKSQAEMQPPPSGKQQMEDMKKAGYSKGGR